MPDRIMTVRGAVAPDRFGFCLPHEHTIIDLVRIFPTQLLAYDFQLLDPVLVAEELGLFVTAVEESPFASAGRPALVDLTSGPRMGRDPKTSVLNSHNQAHDVNNLFVPDGGCMASSSCVNPSLTYMALTARAADFAVNELKRQSL